MQSCLFALEIDMDMDIRGYPCHGWMWIDKTLAPKPTDGYGWIRVFTDEYGWIKVFICGFKWMMPNLPSGPSPQQEKKVCKEKDAVYIFWEKKRDIQIDSGISCPLFD